MMNIKLGVLVFLVHLVTLASCEKQGEIRLTGWTERNGGRLEVYLNGKWGTVSGQTDPRDDDLHLGFGKTVCYQINHYNGDDSSIFTGTVSSLNKHLQKMPGNAHINPDTSLHQVIYDLNCTNKEGQNPRHILRCSYHISKGNINHGEELAVLCPQNASNYDNPHPGQILLATYDIIHGFGYNTFDPSGGYILMYNGTMWAPVPYININGANTLCRQLGYTESSLESLTTTLSNIIYVNLPPLSCTSDYVCLRQCFSKSDAEKLYGNHTTPVQYSIELIMNSIICVFNSGHANTSSPTVSDNCQPYRFELPRHGTEIGIIAIAVSVPVAVCIAIVTTVLLLCCFIKNFYLYRQRKRAKYHEI